MARTNCVNESSRLSDNVIFFCMLGFDLLESLGSDVTVLNTYRLTSQLKSLGRETEKKHQERMA